MAERKPLVSIGGITQEIPAGDTISTDIAPGSGPQGEPGEGVPIGGTTGQVLAKASDTDHDTEWVDAGGGGGGSSLPRVSYSPELDNSRVSTGGSGGGSTTYGSTGRAVSTSAGAGGFSLFKVFPSGNSSSVTPLTGKAIHSWLLHNAIHGTEADLAYWLCANSTLLGAGGITSQIVAHVGFIMEIRSSVVTWYASNANGTTQTKTAITVPSNAESTGVSLSVMYDGTDLLFYVNGALVATHSSNIPAESALVCMQGMVSNRSTASNTVSRLGNYSYSHELG